MCRLTMLDVYDDHDFSLTSEVMRSKINCFHTHRLPFMRGRSPPDMFILVDCGPQRQQH